MQEIDYKQLNMVHGGEDHDGKIVLLSALFGTLMTGTYAGLKYGLNSKDNAPLFIVASGFILGAGGGVIAEQFYYSS